MSELKTIMKNTASGLSTRLWFLAIATIIGFSVIWILPTATILSPSMLKTELPDSISYWQGIDGKISEKEIRILAKDTTFARKSYIEEGDSGLNSIEASIVFSGEDMNNSIHRPERCLTAQGWSFDSESYVYLDVKLDGVDYSLPFKEIIFRRVLFKRSEENEDEQVPLLAKDGKQAYTQRIQYYTFFGNSVVVSGHYERTFNDIKDRVFSAKTQQWAYATFSTQVTEAYKQQGLKIGSVETNSVVDCRKNLEEFIKELLPVMINEQGIESISSLKK